MQGQIAIVTGASSGIGHATALALAAQGATVVGVARREERLAALAERCRATAPASGHLAGDLGERSFAESVVSETLSRHGRLDLLVNNAGIPLRKTLYESTPEDAERVMRINYLASVWTSFAAIPAMLRQGGGTIVNVSSVAAMVVPPHEALYAASKAALSGFSEGLWNDLRGSGIHVALVHSGPVDTEIWERGERAHTFRGRKHPPETVAREILRCIDTRRYEVVVPRSVPLIAARWLRHLAPGLLRRGLARMDGDTTADVAAARRRAQRGLALGDRRPEARDGPARRSTHD